jgi:universal stress protein A
MNPTANTPSDKTSATKPASIEGASQAESAERRLIKLKTILVPIDFSESSKQSLKYAIAFAEQFQASLNLLHVVEFSMVGSDLGAIELSRIEADFVENATRQLDEWVRKEVGARVPAEPIVRSGRPYAEIVDVAETSAADLIIIATHGHSSLAHVLLGSTVERVVRHAPCPVLVVRRQEHDFVEEDSPAGATPLKS